MHIAVVIWIALLVGWCIPLDRDDSMILATPRVAMMMISSLGSLIIV